MAELEFTILADLKKLEKQLNDLFKKKYKLDIGGSSSGGGSKSAAGGKVAAKTNGLLGGILKGLAPLSVLLMMKPVTDLLGLIVNFAMLGFMQIGKLLSGVWTALKEGYDKLMDWATGLSPLLYEKLGAIKDKLIEWFGIAVDWLSQLPSLLWGWIKEGFNWIVEKLLGLWTTLKEIAVNIATWIWEKLQQGFNWLVDKLLSVWETLKGLPEKLWEWIKTGFDWIVEKVVNLWDSIKGLPGLIWESIKEGFTWIKDKLIEVWDIISTLPEKIWEKIKVLPSLIGTAVKNALPKFGFGGGGNNVTSVNDAIIKPNGEVIKTHPNDTIIATKNPDGLGGGGSKVFNFYGVTPQEMLDVIKRELATEVNASSRF